MITIFKYPLTLSDRQFVAMPIVAEILSVQIQPGSGICLWVMVNSESPKTERCFEIFGTGHPITPGIERRFLGTVQEGKFVWHVFERISK